MSGSLVLVGCVSQKLTVAARAKDLYTSELWKQRRRYAESTGRPWMILSAEHGLVEPDRWLEPYDRSMQSEPVAYRVQWSKTVAADVMAACRRIGADRVEIHAGAAYVDHGLGWALTRSGIEVVRPVAGLRIGEQLRWYAQQLQGGVPEELLGGTPQTVSGRAVVEGVATVYRSGALGESWSDLPEVWQRPDTDPRSGRLWVTFVAAVDRAREAVSLWEAAHRAWAEVPWVFDPAKVAAAALGELRDTLQTYRLSQRHRPDSNAWRSIAEAFVSEACPEAIRRAIDGEPVNATDVLGALRTRWPDGSAMFPQLRGPKIGPMWVRMLVFPGGASISGMEAIPVAVDTHVQRVTEMVGLVPVRTLDDHHRADIQQVWFDAVAEAGLFGAPDAIDGTAAGIDPAIWALGKQACSRCESQKRKIPVGQVCDLCVLGRVTSPTAGSVQDRARPKGRPATRSGTRRPRRVLSSFADDPDTYLRRLLHRPDADVAEIIKARDQVVRQYGTLFHPGRLDRLTAEDFKSFLLYENNRHWWGIHRHQAKLVADMDRLRHVLGVLLDESRPIVERIDWVRPAVGDKPLPGLGKAVMTPILHVVYPDRYGVWNAIAESAMKRLGLWPAFVWGASFGNRYATVNDQLHKTADRLGIDLWTLDSLWWMVEREHEPTKHQIAGSENPSQAITQPYVRRAQAVDTFVCESCLLTKATHLRSENPAICIDCA